MRVRILYMLFLLGIIGHLAAAPAEIVRGRVVDQLTGKPLAGVSVSIKGHKGGVTTNEDGWFSKRLQYEVLRHRRKHY